jgi:uncharacterized membrane protein YidH (DUF202 family)
VIDWPHIFFNALWIIGCAIILAALNHTTWLAHERQLRLRQLLKDPSCQLPYILGATLITFGLFLLGNGWLEQLVWAVLTLIFAWQAWDVWRRNKR